MVEQELIRQLPDLTLFFSSVSLALAFSLKTRLAIGKRDNWHCQDEGCDASFQKGDMVHASHYKHDKSDPNYDTVEAGRIQCVEHHQAYHEEHVGAAQEIGLCEDANNYAIRMLKKTDRKKTIFQREVV